MPLPELLTADQVARGSHVIRRSDDAGAILSLNGQGFTHPEMVPETYFAPDVYRGSSERIKQDPLKLWRVTVGAKQDSRWFENYSSTYEFNDADSICAVTYSADLRPFSEEMRLEVKQRMWSAAQSKLATTNYVSPQATEFSTVPPTDTEAARLQVIADYDAAIVAADAATDTVTLARAESDLDTDLTANPIPDPSPWA